MTVAVQDMRAATQRLVRLQGANGGWGYRIGRATAAEPTALACLALSAAGSDRERLVAGLRALTGLQNPEGGVGPLSEVERPCWPTGLAVLAWDCLEEGDGGGEFVTHVRQAVAWLLAARGEPAANAPGVFGHDTSLIAWPWVMGTHSWVEPTAYAVMALRGVGKGKHVRTREGVRVLRDRVIPGGGWNYGNSRVLGATLRPFPATTGIALAAIAGEGLDARVTRSVEYLQRELDHVSAPYSLAWALLGLSAWDAVSQESRLRCLDRLAMREMSSVELSLYLLAAHGALPSRTLTSHDG